MSGPAFFQTHMGQRFYESTMPQLVRQMKRLNDNLERLVAVVEHHAGQQPSSAEPMARTPEDSEGE